MTPSHPSPFLRRTLIVDAYLTGASALLLVLAAQPMSAPLGLPVTFLLGAGISLVPFTMFLIYLLRRGDIPRAAVWFVVACNALWAVDSILLLFSGWVDPTIAGEVFVAFQAVVVAVFAEMQFVALRRSTPRVA